MENNEEQIPGINRIKFEIILTKDWFKQETIPNLVCNYDSYVKDYAPINFWHKIKKLIGLKYKKKDVSKFLVTYKRSLEDGTIERVK